MPKTYLFILIALLFCCENLLAQAPSWSVNSVDFSGNMTFTSQIRLDGSEVNSGANLLGAFVGNELRGVASPIDIGGTAYYFLTVYSNVVSGEELRFDVWLESENAIYPALEKPDFVKNDHLGSYPAGYVINASLLNDFPIDLLTIPDDTTLSSYTFEEIPLEDFLLSQDNDPVAWSVANGLHVMGTLAGDTLQASPIVPNWTGTDSLLVTATETGTPNSYAASQYLRFTINPDYGAPVFGAIPDQFILANQPLPSGDLDDHLTYSGPCLEYAAEVLPPSGSEPNPNWTQPNGGGSSMSLVAQALYGGDTVPGTSNLLAGYVDGQLAGVATQQVLGGKNIFYLTLANVGSGEITLKFYDAVRQYLHEMASGLNFVASGSEGSFTAPFQTDYAPFLIDHSSDGSWTTVLLDPNWTGEQYVLFVAKDCSYPGKIDSVDVKFLVDLCLAGTNTWTGAGDGVNWSDPDNWSGGIAPQNCQDILIPAGSIVKIETGYNAIGKTLEIEIGAELDVELMGVLCIEN